MLWRRRRTEADFRDEIQAHLELETARLVEEGMTPAEAGAAARRAFGNVTSPQEQFYESGRSISLDHLLKDLRFALRLFRKRPGFSAVVVLTLAVGIGVHTAVFSLLSAFVLAPLPFDRPRQLVHIWSTDNKRGLQELRLSDADFEDIRQQAAGYESLAAYDYYDANVKIGEEIVSVRTARVTPDLFQLLGVQPWRGRNFATGESAENVAIVSKDFWERHWGGRLDLSGAQIDINQVPHHIVGVMPSGFTFPMPSIRLWVPLKIVPNPSSRGAGGLMVVGRLKGDRSLEDANAEMRVVATRLERAYPKTNTGRGLRAVPLREALTFFYQELRALLLALNLGAAFVLLIVCANLGNLLLVRAVTRSPEVAMRLALGATRRRLLLQMLVEGAVPAAAGGLVGVAGAKVLTSLGGHFLPEDLYRASDPAINWPVLAFAAAISLMSVLLFALAPALEAIRCRTPQMLGQKMHGSTDSPRARRLRTSLAVGQVALAAILLSGAFFAIQAAVGLQQVESGFSTHGILTFQITPSENRHSGPDQINSFFERLIEEIESLPGVRKAAAVHPLPLNFELFQQEFQIDSGRTKSRRRRYSESHLVTWRLWVCRFQRGVISRPATGRMRQASCSSTRRWRESTGQGKAR